MSKNVTFNTVDELKQEHDAMRGHLPPSTNDELDADRASARKLVQYRYAALVIFLGLIGFVFIVS
jgi:hypothetical protein